MTKGSEFLLGAAAFAAPFVISQRMTGDLAGQGQVIDKAGEYGTTRGLTLGIGLVALAYGFMSDSDAGKAVGTGLALASGAMFAGLTEPKQLKA